MYRLYCRVYQNCLRLASYFVPWHTPVLMEGKNSLTKLPEIIKSEGISSVLIVTDKGIVSAGLLNRLLKGLNDEKINYVVYDETVPNPTIDNVEKALEIYISNKCEGIIAFGGGSPMDCAKGVGARVARPDKSISEMKGILKIRKKIPTLFAVPTTAGTGSEATIAAVITDLRTHEKNIIMDTVLIPDYAVLDPLLTVNLPPQITSTTGMDALTHAIEAYIGKSNTQETKRLSIKAVTLIFENLPEAYFDGMDLNARANMQKASYFAGIAFTRAYVGYVHAIAHALSGLYSVPHGLAIAVSLPHVLEYYGHSVYRPLAELADLVKVSKASDTMEQKAKEFIKAIKRLNERMDIPDKLNIFENDDIPTLVERAFKEANPTYPVPRILSKRDLYNIFNRIKG